MKRWKCLVAVAVFSLVPLSRANACRAAEDQKAGPGKQQPQKLERTIKVTLGYLLYLPKDYAQKDSWPLAHQLSVWTSSPIAASQPQRAAS